MTDFTPRPGGQLAWALWSAARGFRVFPLAEAGSYPIFKGWTESATTDPARIIEWWTRDAPDGRMELDYNIGICTTGLLIIDLDVKNGKRGIENWRDCCELHGEDPELATYTVGTKSGGLHHYYTAPYDVAGNVSVIAPDADARAYHNYVVGAGSVTPEGVYTLEADLPLARAPTFALAACKRPGERLRDKVASTFAELDSASAVALATERAQREPGAVTGLGHNRRAYDFGCELRDCGVSEDAAVDIAMEHWNDRCVPPLGRDELAGLFANSWKYAQNPEGWKHPATHFGNVEIDEPVYIEPAVAPTPCPTKRDRSLQFISIGTIRALPPPRYLIHEFMPEKGLAVDYGPPKSLKTFVKLSQGLHIAAGMPWFGRAVIQGACLYLVGEGAAGMGARVPVMMDYYGIEDDEIPFFLMPRMPNFTDRSAFDELTRKIEQRVGNIPVRMICIDTLARATAGADENSAKDMGAFIARCDELAERFDCLIAPVHHCGKDETRGMRGSSALFGGVDALYATTRDETESHDVVTVKNDAQKDFEECKPLYFDVRKHAAGERSSLVLSHRSGPPDARGNKGKADGGKQLPRQLRVAQEVFRAACMLSGGTRQCPRQAFRDLCIEREVVEAKNFNTLVSRMAAEGLILSEQNGKTLTDRHAMELLK